MAEHLRPATEAEKQNFLDIMFDDIPNKRTAVKIRQKLEKIQKEYYDKEKPFCYPCALTHVNEDLQAQAKEVQYTGNSNISVKYDDVHQFGKANYFIKKGESNVDDFRLEKGIKVKYDSGKHVNYECVKRKHGITLFIASEDVKDLTKISK